MIFAGRATLQDYPSFGIVYEYREGPVQAAGPVNGKFFSGTDLPVSLVHQDHHFLRHRYADTTGRRYRPLARTRSVRTEGCCCVRQ